MKRTISCIIALVIVFAFSSCMAPDTGTSVAVRYGYNIYYDNPMVWHRHPAMPPPKPIYVPKPDRRYIFGGPNPSRHNYQIHKVNPNINKKPIYHSRTFSNRTFGSMNKK